MKSFYSGHYSWYGINIQACADSNCRFIAFSCNSPGGMNDSIAYERWGIDGVLKNLPAPFLLVVTMFTTNAAT